MATTAEVQNLPAADQATLLLLQLQPRGFCADVIRAIEFVELALQKLGKPKCGRKEIIHNRQVVDDRAENGSNSNRLVEVARRAGTEAHLMSCAADLEPEWLDDRKQLVITAGASTPDSLVEQVVNRLKSWGFTDTREVEWTQEDVRFASPPELTAQNSLTGGN